MTRGQDGRKKTQAYHAYSCNEKHKPIRKDDAGIYHISLRQNTAWFARIKRIVGVGLQTGAALGPERWEAGPQGQRDRYDFYKPRVTSSVRKATRVKG